MATANDLFNEENYWVGYCRWDDPQPGTVFGRWYAGWAGDPYYGYSGVAYCAMFQSYCLDKQGITIAGMPGAYCPWILNAFRNAGKLKSARSLGFGDICLFDWEGDGVSDHIGFVLENTGGGLICIEGNTTGSDGRSGSVAVRSRAYSTVIGGATPDYWEAPPAPAPEPAPEPPKLEPKRPGKEPQMAPKTNNAYRLLNEHSGAHFFTSDETEKDALVNGGWKDEGVGFKFAPVVPVYRLYNANNGDHFYTCDYSECNGLIDAGWAYEGDIGYAGTAQSDYTPTPVYRLYNQHDGQHLFTTSEEEKQNVVNSGWTDEGIAFFAIGE